MSAVYVDTSVLLPLMDLGDDYHLAAVDLFDRVTAEGWELLTSSYTVVETGALVRNRLGVKSFQALGELAQGALTIVWVDRVLHDEAWTRAAEEPRRGASLVDWTAFLVMRKYGLTTALAIDKHFREQGFQVLPEVS